MQNLNAKAKFGQNLNLKAFEMIMSDLKKQNTTQDKETLKLMEYFRLK